MVWWCGGVVLWVYYDELFDRLFFQWFLLLSVLAGQEHVRIFQSRLKIWPPSLARKKCDMPIISLPAVFRAKIELPHCCKLPRCWLRNICYYSWLSERRGESCLFTDIHTDTVCSIDLLFIYISISIYLSYWLDLVSIRAVGTCVK